MAKGTAMRRMITVAVALAIIGLGSDLALARGGGGHSSGGHAYSSSGHSTRNGAGAPGTGSKSSYTSVRGYTKKNGTYVAPSKRSTADHNFNNNWSTKGNKNPYTGKSGSRVQPPKSH